MTRTQVGATLVATVLISVAIGVLTIDTGSAQSAAKKDASVEDPDLGPVQEITCEGVNGNVCTVHANNLCGEEKWVPVAYPGDPFPMGRWIHDGGCYTGQAMLVRCKR